MIRRALSLMAWTLAVLLAAATVFFYAKTQERSQLLRAFIDESLQGVDRHDTDAVVHALALAVYVNTNRGVSLSDLPLYERLEATSFFNVTTGTSLKHGIYGVTDNGPFGPCGTMSRVLLNALWELDIPARKLQLLTTPGSGLIQHTMVEYRVGDRWQVISPSDSAFVWHNHAGQVATVEEIRSDSSIFAQVHVAHPWWPASFEHTSNIRWEKLPGPVRRVARLVLGERRYASAQTPALYEQPRRLFMLTALAATVTMALCGWWLGRGGGRTPPARG